MSKNLETILNKLAEKGNMPKRFILNEEMYFLAIESAFNMIIITDDQAVIHYANTAIERITGYSRDEVVGKTPRLWGGQMTSSFFREMWKTIKTGKVFEGEITNRRKNSDSYLAKITISPIKKDGEVVGYIGTEEDITLQRELLKEKEEFISMASHQLRTPLGSMKWALEILREKPSGLEKELADLSKTNQDMIDMVNKLLVVMRIKDNRLELNSEEINPSLLIREVIAGYQERLNDKKITVSPRFQETVKHVSTDKTLLREIIANLIDNSIKYSPSGSNIEVHIIRGQNTWQFKIKDCGMGIPEADIPDLTKKYFRSRNVQNITGTGLGLYIVNTYVQKLKGSLTIKSALGKGTEIICTFPV